MAAYTIMAGSAFVVLLVFETITNLHTMQTREAVEKFLAEPPGDGLGLSVEGALTAMRVLGMIAAGCATAAVILGYQVLRRSRTARIGLTVISVPLLFSGMVTGGFLSSIVVACALLLWLPPARDWFAGRAAPSPPQPRAFETLTPRAPGASGPSSAPTAPHAPPPPTGPQPMAGFGAPVPTHPPRPVPRALPLSGRPPPVLWACALTWCFAGLGAVAMAVGLAYLALAPDTLLADVRQQNPDIADSGISDQMIIVATFIMGGALIVWAIAAIVLAVLLFRGVSWARMLLLISNVGALGLLGLGALGQLVLMVPFLAAALTMTLLLRPETAAWVRR